MEHLLLYQDDAKKINQFYIKLLKPLPGWRLVSHENWFESLAKEYKKRELEVDFPVPSTAGTILTIPLLQRLEILRNLCEFHLEQPEHFWELLKVKDGEADWRIEPIGKDSQNRRYWLFSDARLYREIEGKATSKTTKKQANVLSWDIEDEGNWELICLTRADYDEFLNSLTAEKGKDKSFLKLIRDEIIPKVEPILNYQLSQHRKYFKPVASERISLLPRKRSTRLLAKEIEEEQKRLEREAQEREIQAILKEQQQKKQFSDFTSAPKTAEQVEKDLAAEREMRAEMRRLKKEKEMQIKEIEEAFYSSLDNESGNDADENVEIISEDEEKKIPEEPATPLIPKSPIKIVFKVTKPQEVSIKEDDVDIVNDTVIETKGPENELSDELIVEELESNEISQDVPKVVGETNLIEASETLIETVANESLVNELCTDVSNEILQDSTEIINAHIETPEALIESSANECAVNETSDNLSYFVSEEDANLLNSLSRNL